MWNLNLWESVWHFSRHWHWVYFNGDECLPFEALKFFIPSMSAYSSAFCRTILLLSCFPSASAWSNNSEILASISGKAEFRLLNFGESDEPVFGNARAVSDHPRDPTESKICIYMILLWIFEKNFKIQKLTWIANVSNDLWRQDFWKFCAKENRTIFETDFWIVAEKVRDFSFLSFIQLTLNNF